MLSSFLLLDHDSTSFQSLKHIIYIIVVIIIIIIIIAIDA